MAAARKQKRKVKKVMHEFKRGQLKSGGWRTVKGSPNPTRKRAA